MFSRLFALITVLIAAGAITASYSQRSAFFLKQETQRNYWPRHRTRLSGRYRNGTWVASPSRSTFGGFQGGGPSSGK